MRLAFWHYAESKAYQLYRFCWKRVVKERKRRGMRWC